MNIVPLNTDNEFKFRLINWLNKYEEKMGMFQKGVMALRESITKYFIVCLFHERHNYMILLNRNQPYFYQATYLPFFITKYVL